MKCWSVFGKPAVVALAFAAAGATAFAQLTLKPEPLSTDSHTTLTSGSGASFLKIIITSHGNIRYLESPAGRKHIYAEGYALAAGRWPCAMGGTAFDLGYSEARWIGSPTIVQPNGRNTLPLTITRRAHFDSECVAGPYLLELKQVFDRYSAEREVTITMTVKNVGKLPADGVLLGRWFDGDVDSSTDNMYHATPNSIFAWRVPRPEDGGLMFYRYGLSLTSLTPEFSAWADPVALSWRPDANANNFGDTGFGMTENINPKRGDLAGLLTYQLSIPVGASKTVKVVYRRF